VFGGGEGEEGLLEHRAGQRVQGEPAVDLAVPVLPQVQPGRGGRVPLFLLEELGFVGVGGRGVDDLEQAAAQDLQGLGVERGRLLDQVRLRLGDESRVEVVGELVDGAGDDLGLLDMHPALGQRGARQRM
jgi:hypothetical protein